ncbi:hypothetical protein AMATHDRAFT_77449 [Amanita thiersii Skay4041]|uniref:Branched-chain-amino-acid transaminase n=1 Tax=Amanita thiersii Skay4041 TaxID=703135 RepID=A0A2A9NGJ6_9AGAR|nr:hypothetical protein AMATHDRAFT_77449 [Amanita thiersii Skay4041]
MAIKKTAATNGNGITLNDSRTKLGELDASKLIFTECKTLKAVPPPEQLKFGNVKTDYMLVTEYTPQAGWSAPEIKPYGPLSLDPACSCFQYCPNVFEGMKAYRGPDGKPRLFRPEKNMERLARSAERVALPGFDTDALLILIRCLVALESRWIPDIPGYSMYIRPTIIGTRPALGVAASDQNALLYVIMCPTGPYFRDATKRISLLAVGEHVRAWPGGTGGHKLGLNYAPGFLVQKAALEKGYDQVLWLLPGLEGEANGEGDRVTEAGAMNFFVVVRRSDSSDDVDVFTPPLDGTILPGVTRSSCLALLAAHNSGRFPLPGVSRERKTHPHESVITIGDLIRWAKEGRLVEAFGVGTAVAVAPIGKIGLGGLDVGEERRDELLFPDIEGLGMGQIARGLYDAITSIQTGRVAYDKWSVAC